MPELKGIARHTGLMKKTIDRNYSRIGISTSETKSTFQGIKKIHESSCKMITQAMKQRMSQ